MSPEILSKSQTHSQETLLKIPDLSPKKLKQRLLHFVPELPECASCDVQVLLNRDSSHLGPPEWILIAQTILKSQSSYDGIVVLHGTDTLAYTASALSFLLRPCKKPVILTGAQRPLAAFRSDARRNLISAVEIAARIPHAAFRQVMVFFDDRLLQGNRARKRSASEFAAFDSPQAPALAMVGTTIRYTDPRILMESLQIGKRRSTGRGKKLKPLFSKKVAMVHITPGSQFKMFEKMLPELDALIFIAFPSGTAPTHQQDFLELLNQAKVKNIPVVLITEGITPPPQRLSSNRLSRDRNDNPSAYEASKPLIEAGCIWGGRITPECAYVKASLICGQPDGKRQFNTLWKENWAGEF